MLKNPKTTKSKKIGSLAVTYCQTYFEKHNWNFRRLEDQNDFGIDAEFEIVDDNVITGKICKCQIKGMSSIKWNKGNASVRVKVTTWNLWNNLNLPIIVFLVDIKENNIYWSLPLSSTPKKDNKSVAIHFNKNNSLNTNFYEFRGIINTWITSFPKHNILRDVPIFHKMFYERLKNVVDGGDPWCDIGEELNNDVRLFYHHVLEIRSSLGLPNNNIFPFEFWLIRNAAIWDSSMILFHATVSELLLFITPFYEEAINIIIERIRDIEPKFENNEIINYFRLHPIYEEIVKKGSTLVELVAQHPYEEYDEFHKRMESVLEKTNALRVKWKKKNI